MTEFKRMGGANDFVDDAGEWSGDGATLVNLGQLAAEALLEEDRSLAAALGGDSRESFAGEPRGLTYWLYETTLVYLIFKKWANRYYVKWDWEKVPKQAKRRGATPHLDLVVNLHDAEVGFEAKWWNTSSIEKYMEHDAEKLLRWVAGKSSQKRHAALLAFWWTTKDRASDDAAKGDGFLQGKTLAYRAAFPTLGRGHEKRVFVMDVIALTA